MAGAGAIQSYEDARALARKHLPWMVFDYIDGAAGTGFGEVANLTALRNIRLQSRILVNVTQRDLGVDLFGQRAAMPFGVSPMALCNLVSPRADRELAKMAARHNIPLGVSTISSTPMEKLLSLANGNAWFQLYYSGDGSSTMKLLERAQTAGYKTLVLTVDVPELGRRPRELRRGFKMPFRIGPKQFVDFALHPRWSLSMLAGGKPEMANFAMPGYSFDRTESRGSADWDVLARMRDAWKGNLVVKGVTSVADAVALRDAGVDAVQVSSHGGRQLDAAVPPILALRDIRAAVGPDFPVFYDTGLRSGEDVVKAYAMGASFVFFGRAMQFAIAAGGSAGLNQYWDLIASDVSVTLAQLGKTGMTGLPDCLVQ